MSYLASRSHWGRFYWLENTPEQGGAPVTSWLRPPSCAHPCSLANPDLCGSSKCLRPSQPIYNASLYGWFNSQTSTLHGGINVSQPHTQPHPFPHTGVRNPHLPLHQNTQLSCIVRPASPRLCCWASLIPPSFEIPWWARRLGQEPPVPVFQAFSPALGTAVANRNTGQQLDPQHQGSSAEFGGGGVVRYPGVRPWKWRFYLHPIPPEMVLCFREEGNAGILSSFSLTKRLREMTFVLLSSPFLEEIPNLKPMKGTTNFSAISSKTQRGNVGLFNLLWMRLPYQTWSFNSIG